MSVVYSVIESELWEDAGGEFELEGDFLGAFSSEARARVAIAAAIFEKRCAGERSRYRYIACMSALDAPVRINSYVVWSYHAFSEAEPRSFEVRYEYDPEFLAKAAALAPARVGAPPCDAV